MNIFEIIMSGMVFSITFTVLLSTPNDMVIVNNKGINTLILMILLLSSWFGATIVLIIWGIYKWNGKKYKKTRYSKSYDDYCANRENV